MAYFEKVDGVHPIPEGLNPATWMLEVTMPGNEDRLGVDFAELYAQSDLIRHVPFVPQPALSVSPLAYLCSCRVGVETLHRDVMVLLFGSCMYAIIY